MIIPDPWPGRALAVSLCREPFQADL